MAIIFKKNGRPTKASKILVRKINNFLDTLNDSEKRNYSFENEVVTSEERLEKIWDKLSYPTNEEVNDNTASEDIIVDTDTGEIIEKKEHKNVEQAEEETNFVKADKMEDTKIIDEINEDASQEEVPSFFNPLSEPIKQRSYNKQEQTNVGEIEEPNFSNNASAQERLDDINESESNVEEEIFVEDEVESTNDWDNVSNEAMEELPDKDKKLAATQLVQTVLDGYEMLHELGKNFVKYPEDKLQEKIIKGDIDPTMEIPLDENGTTTNPVEFFQNFNEQAEEAISYDPEFGEKVRPAMERVFAKKGWGMTDEQFLLVAFGKDAAWKGVQIMTLKKTANGIMNTFEQLQKDKIEAIKQSNRAQRRAAPPIQPDAIVTPPQREPIQKEVYEAEEVTNQSNEEGIVPIH